MKNLLRIAFLTVLIFSFVFGGNWTFDKLFIDFELPQDNGYGIHGVAVAPDGNIWLALHGGLADEPCIVDGDTVGIYRPVYVLDPTTGNHVSFSPINVLEFPDGTLDTLHTNSPHNGSGKGISVDKDGNILYTSWSTVYRINYQTGACMNRFIPTAFMGSMTEAVQDANGLIYVGYVGKMHQLYILDNDFNLVGNAVDTVKYLNRTLAVTSDGKDLYTGSTWNGFGIVHWHSDIPGVFQYTAVDTLGNWYDYYDATLDSTYDVKLWPSCLDWGPDGLLWAGNLRPDWSGSKGGMYYAFDVTTGQIVDSVGIAMGDSSAGGVYSPRGAAWSADGNTMYLADFDYNVVSVWTKTTGIEDENLRVLRTFNLSQNFPNPFNPTTTIPFTIENSGLIKLIVYDMLGHEVATLVNKKMNPGSYKFDFDATGHATGMYIYRLTVDGKQMAKKMLYVK